MTRYAQVGLGLRSWLYSVAIVDQYPAKNELVAVCDRNAGRLQQRLDWAADNGCAAVGYATADYDRMLAEGRPDVVIVTTPDGTHDDLIVRALEAGCDVLTEKPMTIDAARCRRILEARERTGRRCTVTFNYRYSPPRLQLRELLASGVIGEVVSVDFHWLLDTTHGADYFRRWHRNKAMSGGLLVHKATHHFDLVNWWLDSVPERVSARGSRAYYTPERADALGLAGRGERCRGCPVAARCPFHLDLEARAELKACYLDHEHHDGYLRDRCVFAPEIDIEDTMQVIVDYRSGARMSYSLHAFMPWEGYTIAFNGTAGRLEHTCEEAVTASGDAATPGALRAEGSSIRVFPHFAPAYDVPVREAEGSHAGADRLLLEALFGEADVDDPYGRAADHRAGAWSILTGIAANCSIETGGPVEIAALWDGDPPPGLS